MSEVPCRSSTGTSIRIPRSTNATGLCSWKTESRSGTPSTFCPKEDGDYLILGQDHGENHQEIARHSKHDADAYDAFNHDVTKVLQAIKPLMDEAPPDFWSDDPEELILERVVTFPEGYQPPVVRGIDVHWEEQTEIEYKTVRILPDELTLDVLDRRNAPPLNAEKA